MTKKSIKGLITIIQSYETTKPGWIYAMGDPVSSIVKIGRSSNYAHILGSPCP